MFNKIFKNWNVNSYILPLLESKYFNYCKVQNVKQAIYYISNLDYKDLNNNKSVYDS